MNENQFTEFDHPAETPGQHESYNFVENLKVIEKNITGKLQDQSQICVFTVTSVIKCVLLVTKTLILAKAILWLLHIFNLCVKTDSYL